MNLIGIKLFNFVACVCLYVFVDVDCFNVLHINRDWQKMNVTYAMCCEIIGVWDFLWELNMVSLLIWLSLYKMTLKLS